MYRAERFMCYSELIVPVCKEQSGFCVIVS